MGASSRGIVLAHATGFSSAFSYLRARGLLSEWDAVGGDKLGAVELLASVVLCLSSYVPECLMSELLRDSRVCLQLDSLEALFREEVAYLDNLSAGFWELLSAIVNTPPFILRDRVMQAVTVIESYITPRFFQVCRSLPWCLAVGNLPANVSDLALMETAPEEACTRKLWEMLKRGGSEGEMCSWTSHFAEKLHAASALFKRHHSYSLGTLMARSFLYSFRQLVTGPPREETYLKRQRARVTKLRQKSFCHLTGRQLFLSEMLMKRKTGGRLKLHKLSARGVMKQHGEIWNSLAARKKSVYEEKARHLRQRKTLEVEEELQDEAGTLQALVERESGAGQAGTPNMSMCKLTDKDLDQFATLLQSAAIPQSHVQKLRTKALECPAPLAHATFAALHASSSLCDPVQSSWSQQAARVMRARDLLQGKVLGVRSADNEISWFMYGLAVLKPLHLTLVPLQQIDLGVSWSQLSLSTAFNVQSMFVTFAWTYEAGLLETADVFEGRSESDIYVLDECFYKAPGIIVSFGSLTCLKQFLTGWVARGNTELGDTPQDKPKKHASSSSGGGGNDWMTVLQQMGTETSVQRKNSVTNAPPNEPSESEEDMEVSNDEEELPSHEAWKQVETLRQALDDSAFDFSLHFRDAVEGGKWRFQETGSMVYGHRSTVLASSELLEFVKKFGLRQSLSLELQKYGSSGPHLVRVWQHRLVHLWRHWLESGQPASYPRESLPAYECSVPVPETLVLNAASSKRKHDLIALLP
eukprot:3568876-Amphidinium_carterae.1